MEKVRSVCYCNTAMIFVFSVSHPIRVLAKSYQNLLSICNGGKRESWQLSIITVVSNNNDVKDDSQHGTLAMGQALFYVFTVCLSFHLISTVLKGVLFYFSTDGYLRGTARLGNLPVETLLEVMKTI